jgi:hypothetical protein
MYYLCITLIKYTHFHDLRIHARIAQHVNAKDFYEFLFQILIFNELDSWLMFALELS